MRLSLRFKFILLVFSVAIPLFLTAIISYNYDLNSFRQNKESEMLQIARQVASHLDRFFDDSRKLLAFLAGMDGIKDFNRAETEKIFDQVLTNYEGIYGHIYLIDKNGYLRASCRRTPDQEINWVGDKSFFLESLELDKATISDPERDAHSKNPTFYVTHPIKNERGDMQGLLAMAIDPVRFEGIWKHTALASQYTATLTTQKGKIVTRNYLPERFAGQGVDSAYVEKIFSQSDFAKEIFCTIDKMKKVVGYTKLRSVNWLVSVGTPSSMIYGDLRTSLFWRLLIYTVVFSGALVGALHYADIIYKKIKRLQVDTEKIAKGSSDKHIVNLGGDEVDILAEAMERMRENLVYSHQALRESENYFQALFNSIPEAVYVFDSETLRFLAVNDIMVARYGYTREEFLNMDATQIRPADEVPKMMEVLTQEFQGWPEFTGEFIHQRKDGAKFPVLIYRHKLNLNGKPSFVVVAVDNTQMAQIQKEKAFLAKASKIFNSTLDFSEIVDAVTKITAEILGDSCTIFLKEEGREFLSLASLYSACMKNAKEEVQKLLENKPISLNDAHSCKVLLLGESLLFESPLNEEKLKDYFRPFGMESFLAVPLKSKNKILGVLASGSTAKGKKMGKRELELAEEIADRAALALENARLFRDVELLERKRRALFDSASDAIFITDVDGNILETNEIACKSLGYTMTELIGKNFLELKSPDSGRQLHTIIDTILINKPFIFEHEHQRKDGSIFPVEINARLVELPGQKVIQSIVRDITDRKKAEKQLIQAQKMEAVGQLAGGIAHDFNNILSGITGYTSLMKTKIDESHPFFHGMSVIEKAAWRAADLTKQLLGFARGGKYEVKKIDLNQVVENVLHIVRETFDRAIEIRTHLSGHLCTIEGDQGQMEHVLLNLCLNARDAMPSGGKLLIETSNVTLDESYTKSHLGAKSGDYALLSVSDSGVGIPKAIQSKIFDPFFTTKEFGKGTGMGLAMVYGIVKNHEGYVTVYSEPGKGACFKIYLSATKKLEPEGVIQSGEEIPRGTETILLVDDEEVVIEMGKSILEALGYQVILAKNGQEACLIYKDKCNEIDLVLLDMVMPAMGGRETYLQLREIKRQVKVLLSSGYSLNGISQEILGEGARGFVQKPFGVQQLGQSVRQALNSV